MIIVGDMEMCTGYPVVMVVVVVKEIATTEANAMIPVITEEGDMDFCCCIVSTKKSIKSFEARISCQKNLLSQSDNRLLGRHANEITLFRRLNYQCLDKRL